METSSSGSTALDSRCHPLSVRNVAAPRSADDNSPAADGSQESDHNKAISESQEGSGPGADTMPFEPQTPILLRKSASSRLKQSVRHSSDSITPGESRRSSFSTVLLLKRQKTLGNITTASFAVRSGSMPPSDLRLISATAAKNAQHESMVERFQVRKLQRAQSIDWSLEPGQEDTIAKPETGDHTTLVHSSSVLPRSQAVEAVDASIANPQPATVPHDAQERFAGRLDSSTHVEEETQIHVDWDVRSRPVRWSLHRALAVWRRDFARRIRQAAARLVMPLSRNSTTMHVKNAVLLIVFAVYFVLYPVELAFLHREEEPKWLKHFDYVRELLFAGNLLLTFNTSFTDEQGEIVLSHRRIARNYLQGWFLPDLIASIPVHLLLDGAAQGQDDQVGTGFAIAFSVENFVHVVRIALFLWFVRLSRSARSIWTWLTYSRYSHLVRIFWIVLALLLLSHYVACIWIRLGGRDTPDASPAEVYTASFYDALQLLQGQGVPTATMYQSLFASAAMLLGSIALAIMFGHVAMLVANFNANSTSYQRKMEAVFAITSKMQLPEPFRERIHQYYNHLWREYESLDGEIERFSKNLSHTLEIEVVLYKYMDLVMSIPFWKDCSPDFQKQLMLHLHVRVYLPDDYVIRRGEVDEEFYMINRGSVELVTGPDSFERPVGDAKVHDVASGGKGVIPISSNRTQSDTTKTGPVVSKYEQGGSKKVVHQLATGQAIGELALLMNYQRTADVRAITYVEMCVLNRSDFQRVVTSHPEDRKKVVSAMLSSCMAKNEVEGVFCPLTEMVRSVYSASRDPPIDALEASELILEVANPDLEDRSIKFGINTKLRSRLVERRDSRRVKSGKQIHTRAAEIAQGSTPAPIVTPPHCGGHCPVISRIERLEQAIEALIVTVSRLSAPPTQAANEDRQCVHQSLAVPEPHCQVASRANITLSEEASTSQSQPSHGSRISRIDYAAASDAQPSGLPRIVPARTRADPPATPDGPVRLASVRRSLSSIALVLASPRSSVVSSPTQFADELFRTRPRAVFSRRSAVEMADSPFNIANTSSHKHG